jgi:hypothetical protein
MVSGAIMKNCVSEKDYICTNKNSLHYQLLCPFKCALYEEMIEDLYLEETKACERVKRRKVK